MSIMVSLDMEAFVKAEIAAHDPRAIRLYERDSSSSIFFHFCMKTPSAKIAALCDILNDLLESGRDAPTNNTSRDDGMAQAGAQ